MTATVVVGAQYGDEGKGRIVDYLATDADMVIRFQGGSNAGHTVINDQGKFALHLIPSGIFNPDTVNVIGTGCVVNPQSLLAELRDLEQAGVDTRNLWVSSRAQMLMPYHAEMDALEENFRDPGQKIGTTKQGIGPAYEDKMARRGLRMGDLLDSAWLEERVANAVVRTRQKLEALGGAPLDADAVWAFCQAARTHLQDRIVDTVPLVRSALDAGRTLLLEGQLGLMRDVDWGVYPFVTSSHPSAAYAAVGGGLPLQAITRVIGITKAYATAVGAGPFPTELADATGEKLRTLGAEFGATTGRPRRCGWLDIVTLRHCAWLNGMTELALTKLDILDAFATIKVCTGYALPHGQTETRYMPDTAALQQVEPRYTELPGWQQDTTACRAWEELPPQAQAFVTFVSERTGLPITLIGVGPAREQIVVNPQ